MAIDLVALVQRILTLLTNPQKTWRVIRSEPDRGHRLITHYVLLLATIPSVCGFVGTLLFDQRFTFGDRFVFSLVASVLKLGIFVGSVFILGLLVNAMAPSFDTSRSENNSFKLVAYASTPVWLAGFLTLIPQLTGLAALGGFGYAAYLFTLGVQELMGCPAKRAWHFSIASVVAWFFFTLVTTWIAVQITGLMFTPALILDRLVQPTQSPLH